MSTPFPLEMRLGSFIPVTEAQRQFVSTAQALIAEYGVRLARVIYPAKFDRTSSVAPAEVGDASCIGSGFVSQRLGFLAAASKDRFLFYNGDADVLSFSVAYKCPKLEKPDEEHYHLLRGILEEGHDLWKQFPIGEVLDGLEELYQRLVGEQQQYEEAHAILHNKLLALQSIKEDMSVSAE